MLSCNYYQYCTFHIPLLTYIYGGFLLLRDLAGLKPLPTALFPSLLYGVAIRCHLKRHPIPVEHLLWSHFCGLHSTIKVNLMHGLLSCLISNLDLVPSSECWPKHFKEAAEERSSFPKPGLC